MKMRDEGRASLVDFLRSIKFTQQNTAAAANGCADSCATHFASLQTRVGRTQLRGAEESQLIRSAN
jgi:hypothetical protein